MRLRSTWILATAALLLVGCVPLPAAPPAQESPAGDGMPQNMASHGILLTADGVAPTAAATAAPVPSEPVEGAVQIVAYVDPMCPYCRDFLTANAEHILELVADGSATFELHPIAILDDTNGDSSSRAVNAIAAVADAQPEALVDFVTTVFLEQPPEGTPVTNDDLASQAGEAGVTAPQVTEAIASESFMPFVEASTSWALAQPAASTTSEVVAATPTIFVGGERFDGAADDAVAFAEAVESAG